MFEGELKATRTQAHTASRAMERLSGPITPYIFGERQNVDCLEDLNYASSWGLGESHLSNWVSFYNPNLADSSSKSFHERLPSIGFIQMLEQARSPIAASSPLFPTDHNLNMLLRLPQKLNYLTEVDSRVQGTELESCITHVSEAQSPVKSETNKYHNPLTSRADEVGSSANQEPNSPEICKDGTSGCSTWLLNPTQQTKPPLSRRKRKRLKPSKNSEEVESQRMTHITVERNRRKQMNEHLSALRSLMPTSFIQRGDQASIIGGAIDFVKELEQLLQSLQAQKRRRQSENGYSPDSSVPFNGFFLSPQYTTYSSQCNLKYVLDNYIEHGGNEFTAENKSALADIEVTLIQTHANLKVLSERRPGQLVKAIAALENLKLTILHLNITSLERSVLYSFNLKIEEDCKFRSADEIATAVHQIFSLINGS